MSMWSLPQELAEHLCRPSLSFCDNFFRGETFGERTPRYYVRINLKASIRQDNLYVLPLVHTGLIRTDRMACTQVLL
jgi:hypothetical protein